MEELWQKIKKYCAAQGIASVGCSRPDSAPLAELSLAVSIVVPLSRAVVDEITDRPTHTYFHHYRTVNAHIDRSLLEIGFLLQAAGWRYYPIGASQSIPDPATGKGFQGRFSHKQAAVSAGLGGIGMNDLFLHPEYGAAVRLGTLFTDAPLPVTEPLALSPCTGCGACVRACPAGALRGEMWQQGGPSPVDAAACSDYMKRVFQKIGRGAVCGICMRVCPVGQKR